MESPKVNFTNEETRKLRELVEHNKYVLFNKKSTAVSNRLKDETWNAIAQEFNSCSTTYRSAKQLKYKFDNMKKLARKEMKDYVYDGSGHCPMSNAISNSLQNNLPLSSDAEWLSGLVSAPMAGGIPELQADTTQNNTHFISPDMVPEKRKRELGSPPQMRKKLSSISEMKNRLLHSREVLVKKENMLLSSHIEELHRQEMAHKAERHLAQLEHESKLNEAQLNKLAMEAKLYESQLNKVALESRQLELQQARDAELHAVRMAREAELHEARLAREAELHAALLARETGQHIMRNM